MEHKHSPSNSVPLTKRSPHAASQTEARHVQANVLSMSGIIQMQRTVGNRAVGRMLQDRMRISSQKNSTSAAIVQRQMTETTEKDHYTDSRDQGEYSLVFHKVGEGIYKEMYSGNYYTHDSSTDQLKDMEGNYFDPFYKATFYATSSDGYYQDGDGNYYYYQNGYYYPYSSQTTSGMNENQDALEQPLEELKEEPDEEARSWLINEKIRDRRNVAIAFIESNVYLDKRKAVEIIEKWNAAFPDKKLALADFNLSPADKDQKAEEKEKESDSNRRKLPGTMAELSIGSNVFQCKLLTNEGGYHDIYEIMDDRPLFSGVNNADLLVRIPVNHTENPVGKGALMHQKLGKLIRVPRMFNKPERDNLYVVERIANECDPSVWGGNVPLEALTETQFNQLEQIKSILQQVAHEVFNGGGKEPVPDFRPANIRFTVQNELVLIDFSEESEDHKPNEMELFAVKLQENVNQFAGLIREKRSKVNPFVYDYLTKEFPKQLLELMKNAVDFS
jgi:hypothetical protein